METPREPKKETDRNRSRVKNGYGYRNKVKTETERKTTTTINTEKATMRATAMGKEIETKKDITETWTKTET